MPSQDLSVTEEAHEQKSGSSYSANPSPVRIDSNSTSSFSYNALFRFILTSSIPSGSTADDAFIRIDAAGAAGDDPNLDIYFEDVADSDDLATTADVIGRTPTTNTVAWVTTGIGTSLVASPSFTSALQELIDTYGGLSSGDAITVLFITNTDASQILRLTSGAAELYLEWTEPAAGGHAGTAVNHPAPLKSKLQGLVK